jgi:hypothetical protein
VSSSVDTSPILDALAEVQNEGIAILVAFLVMAMLIQAVKWLRHAGVEGAITEDGDVDFDDADDLGEWSGEFDGEDLSDYTDADYFASCSCCGLNSIDDAELFDLDHSDACPQCGNDLDMCDVR